MRAVSFLIVSILLAFIEPACAEELNTKDLRIFAIDFAWNRKGPPAEWIPVGLVVHESDANKRPSGPFTTAAAFRKWITSMPRSSILRYDAGCVAVSSLPVGKGMITIDEIEKLCKATGVKFELLVGW